MDGISTLPDVARDLGASADRVRRAATRLGMQLPRAGSSPRAPMLVTASQRAALADALGTTPARSGLTRAQVQVLSALAHAPRGVVSTRAVARRASVSPTTAGRALEHLVDAGIAVRRFERLALGHVTDVEMYRLDRRSPKWHGLAPLVARTRPPRRGIVPTHRVPNELLHVFWNSHWNQLQVDTASEYVARRLVSSGDVDALAWGAQHLDADAWEHAARTRGLSARRRRLAENLTAEAAA